MTMKKQQLSILIMAILILPAFGASAQEDSTKISEGNRSQLRLGLTGYLRPDSNFGLELEYERFISSHWGVELNLFSDLKTNNNFTSSYQSGSSFGLNNYQSELIGGLAVNYYLKKDKRSGHYFSLSANYLFGTYTRRQYRVDLQTGEVTERGKRLFDSNPVVGLHYGYRKTFNSGLFIEGRIGVLYEDSINNLFRLRKYSYGIDGQITVGWVIPFKKKH